MAPVWLCDELKFSPCSELRLLCDTPGVPLDESNLVMKAVRLMEKEMGRKVGWEIRLVKNIPHGAGLGGGSSDAASTLLALNELEAVGLSRSRLIELAAELGSDVGFFIEGVVCRCTGRGEMVALEPSLQEFYGTILLMKPEFGVSTPDAYKRWRTSSKLPGIDYDSHSWQGIEFVNDLERPVFEKFLFLAEVKLWLARQEGIHVAMMSGSGSTMFAFVDSPGRGRILAELAKRELDPSLWCWVGSCGSKDRL